MYYNYSDLDGWSVVSDSYEGSVKNGKEHTITGAGNVSLWYCQDHVENNNRTYACSVVALCNLAKYYRDTLTLTDMIIPEKTAGLLVCQNDEEEEKFLVNWSGTSLCCCFYDSHD